MTTSDDDLPRALQVLWGRSTARRRGNQTLNLERIVAAAIELADEEGIAALSMARLAGRLGSAPMSLYRHVSSKDELQTFMIEQAVGEPPFARIANVDWRTGLAHWARRLHGVYLRHPWILQVTTSAPPLEPGQLSWLECGLQALSDTGLSPRDRLDTALLLVYYTRGEAQLAIGSAASVRQTGLSEQDNNARYGRTLARLVDPEQFPELVELVAAGAFAPAGTGTRSSFDYGLDRILDGIAARVSPMT
jgi:AcrR family transcriptional regulator